MSFMNFSIQPHAVSSRRRRLHVLRRRTAIPAIVIVDDRRVLTRLVERPHVGARLDIGDSVVVTQMKDVAGGGLIVTARRAGNAAAD
jgi:hypothetical protein